MNQTQSKTKTEFREDYKSAKEFQQCACQYCECGNIIDKAFWCCTYCAEVHNKLDVKIK